MAQRVIKNGNEVYDLGIRMLAEDPDGIIEGSNGDLAIRVIGPTAEVWQNTDGDKAWKCISQTPPAILRFGSNRPYAEARSVNQWTVLGQFSFEGTDRMRPSRLIAVVSGRGIRPFGIRIIDQGSGAIISEQTGLTFSQPVRLDLGTPANLPATPTIIDVLMRGESTGARGRISSLMLEF